MAEILIPGDELEQLGRLLGGVREAVGNFGDLPSLLDGDPADSLGDPRLLRSVGEFHGRWDDGHYQLRKETETLDKTSSDILKAFRDTDEELGKALTDPGSAS